MSRFSGKFEHLPGVWCDRFETGGGNVLLGEQYFLSHCHTDHMKGLENLARHLKDKHQNKQSGSNKNKLYCSSISKAFIKYKYNIPEEAIVDLEHNDSKEIWVFDTVTFYKLKVTGIGANHCPGSLMFLFEKYNTDEDRIEHVEKRILYTGDFRYDSERPLTDLYSLHDRLDGTPLRIDQLYLDATFCSEDYEFFPPRKEVEDKIWEQCAYWIKRNGKHKNGKVKHVILLTLPARYGYERILQRIYEKSNKNLRIHVSREKFEDYMCSKELADCVEPDPKKAEWIHACIMKNDATKRLRSNLPCLAGKGEYQVCTIKPSAQFFTRNQQDKLFRAGMDPARSFSEGLSFYRFCYSTHSSLTELTKFILHFASRDTDIIPCAYPNFNGEIDLPAADTEENDTQAKYRQEKERDRKARIRVNKLLENIRERLPIPGYLGGGSSPIAPLNLLANPGSPSSFNSSNDSLKWLDFSQGLDMTPPAESPLKVKFDENYVYDMDSRTCNSSDDEEQEDSCMPLISNDIEIIPGKVTGLQSIHEGLTSNTNTSITISGENGSIIAENGSIIAESRRRTFARNRVDPSSYSMPAQQNFQQEVPKERRSSMPSNMKLPLIKVTPSSPSPHPDDPDYPEFFQCNTYLEHVGKNLDNRDDEENEEIVSERAEHIEIQPAPTTNFQKRRFKRQQSMFSEDDSGSTSFKKPKLASLGISFDDCNNDSERLNDACENTKDNTPPKTVQKATSSIQNENIKDSIEYAQDDKTILDDEADNNDDNAIVRSSSCTSSYSRKRKFNLFHSSPQVSPVKRSILVAETQDILDTHHIQESQDILDHESQDILDDQVFLESQQIGKSQMMLDNQNDEIVENEIVSSLKNLENNGIIMEKSDQDDKSTHDSTANNIENGLVSLKILSSSRFSSKSSYSRKRKFNLFQFSPEVLPVKHRVLVKETQDIFGTHASQEIVECQNNMLADDIDQVVENEMVESARDIDISSADQHYESPHISKDGDSDVSCILIGSSPMMRSPSPPSSPNLLKQ